MGPRILPFTKGRKGGIIRDYKKGYFRFNLIHTGG